MVQYQYWLGNHLVSTPHLFYLVIVRVRDKDDSLLPDCNSQRVLQLGFHSNAVDVAVGEKIGRVSVHMNKKLKSCLFFLSGFIISCLSPPQTALTAPPFLMSTILTEELSLSATNSRWEASSHERPEG